MNHKSLMHLRPLRSLALGIILTSLAHAADQATGPDIPENVVSGLYMRAKKSPTDKAERIKFYAEILADGRKCLAEHPDVLPTAANRELLLRRVMLPAAATLYRTEPTTENRDQLRALAKEVVETPVYEGHQLAEEKVRAAATLANLEISPEKDAPPRDAATHIKALVNRFPVVPERKSSEDFHKQALVSAARLACEFKEKALADEYCKEIASTCLATPGAVDVLAMAGHAPLFEAELTTLDGKTLHFPSDAKGKVVVLDFWATWCGPCVNSLPHVREIHEKFKDKNVWVIGVSCDSPMSKETPEQNKQKVADFIKTKGLEWTQAYSGQWPQAAVKYGISNIPTVFVIGKDGRIVSASARGREEMLIEQALAAP